MKITANFIIFTQFVKKIYLRLENLGFKNRKQYIFLQHQFDEMSYLLNC